jgi:AbrB family looped-hinge helix DNA binding protein
MKNAIETTIDQAGRMVVPKAIRERAGLRPGMRLEITVRDGRIEIEPAPRDVRIVRRDGLAVAEPVGPVEPLSEEKVRRVRDETREQRKPR